MEGREEVVDEEEDEDDDEGEEEGDSIAEKGEWEGASASWATAGAPKIGERSSSRTEFALTLFLFLSRMS